MGSTTLFTFLFDSPVIARSVELLGSWDNFAKSYHLKQDKRRSPRTWTGCFTFSGIICDGVFGQQQDKRDGALLTGGTYWYYYKINDDEEHYNNLEPSTTICPLLPGQRVNILDVPMEATSKATSHVDDGFTRRPQDRFLTPVPPKALPSPRLGDLCQESYRPEPRSPANSSKSTCNSPSFAYQASGTASASPATPVCNGFEFKPFKTRRSTSRSRGRSKKRNVTELEIGAPTLISTTAEDVSLIPLPSAHSPIPLASAPLTKSAPMVAPLPPSISAKLREFSPLGSHPVRSSNVHEMSCEKTEKCLPKRPTSLVSGLEPCASDVGTGRSRANSSGIRRTKIFSNEPWISSPRLPPHLDAKEESYDAPVLQRSPVMLEPSSESIEQRPRSRNGGAQDSALRKTPTDKDLPALPRYLVPAPLFACNSGVGTSAPHEQAQPEEKIDKRVQSRDVHPKESSASHFFTWSGDSMMTFSPISEDGLSQSPTFSSLTTASSVPDSPQRESLNFDYVEEGFKDDVKDSLLDRRSRDGHLDASAKSPSFRLPVPSMGSSIFQFDIQRAEAGSRRQAACFGLPNVQEYSLPEDDQITIRKTNSNNEHDEPAIKTDHRDSSISQIEKLMDDFGFLGEAVL